MIKKQFSSTINAPVKKVWDNMISDTGYRKRTQPFNPAGSWFEGTREKGTQMKFLGPHPEHPEQIGGMVAEIAENKIYEFISIRHYAEISNGEIRTDSEWTNAFENYSFSEKDGITTLTVDIDMTEPMVEYMESAWPEAIAALKDLCESS